MLLVGGRGEEYVRQGRSAIAWLVLCESLIGPHFFAMWRPQTKNSSLPLEVDDLSMENEVDQEKKYNQPPHPVLF